ncbi:Rhodanese-like domain-containing protein [Aspergillus avenaceus]|uniref:Rhodanese-like domain-containing protein n=1 Tax=Aspergillus avenaceus TaxID=36643 RepID=A0A5N6TP16_ASPAV|nr:Rhodanese-like domain-containing protein [Aspergillus avenaceus]
MSRTIRPLTTLLTSRALPKITTPAPRLIPTRQFATRPSIQNGLNPVHQNIIPKRWKSDTKNTPRQWGFEDINASLPTTTPSPPSRPQKDLILIDVREPAELAATGIIPSAISVPLASQPDAFFLTPEEFENRFGYPKPGVGERGDVVFYCKAGVRARAAAQLAVQAGYDVERVGVYEGSWLDWAGRGGRVERWEGDE